MTRHMLWPILSKSKVNSTTALARELILDQKYGQSPSKSLLQSIWSCRRQIKMVMFRDHSLQLGQLMRMFIIILYKNISSLLLTSITIDQISYFGPIQRVRIMQTTSWSYSKVTVSNMCARMKIPLTCLRLDPLNNSGPYVSLYINPGRNQPLVQLDSREYGLNYQENVQKTVHKRQRPALSGNCAQFETTGSTVLFLSDFYSALFSVQEVVQTKDVG